MRIWLIALSAALLSATTAWAGDGCGCPSACDPACNAGCEKKACGHDHGCCPKCGCKLECCVVPAKKDVKKPQYKVKCEPFCPSLPKLPFFGKKDCGDPCSAGGQCGVSCEQPAGCGKSCGKGKSCDPCAHEKNKVVTPPNCGHVRVRKVLECSEITCEMNVYKCIPVCPHCCNKGCGEACGAAGGTPPAETKTDGGEIPPPPPPPPGGQTKVAPKAPLLGALLAK
jgi:hypothetical protein